MNFLRSNAYSGGIAKIYFLPLSLFNGVTYSPELGYVSPSVFVNAVELPFNIDSGRFSFQMSKNVWQVSVNALVRGINQNIFVFLNQWAYMPFLIVIQDYNKNTILLGNEDNFFLYDPSFNSNADFSETSGFPFAISKLITARPVFISNSVVNNNEEEIPELVPPQAISLWVSGFITSGAVLTGKYSYYDPQGLSEKNSVYAWYIADDSEGLNSSLIPNSNAISITVNFDVENKYIAFAVTPSNGVSNGSQARSNFYSSERHPYRFFHNHRAVFHEGFINNSAGEPYFRIPSKEDWEALEMAVRKTQPDAADFSGGALKSTRTEPEMHPSWKYPNRNATNEYNFAALPTGGAFYHYSDQRTYQMVLNYAIFWTSSSDGMLRYVACLAYNTGRLIFIATDNNRVCVGAAVRLCRPLKPSETSLQNGSYCEKYIGNDGAEYKTVKIGNLVWTAESSIEQYLPDGTRIATHPPQGRTGVDYWGDAFRNSAAQYKYLRGYPSSYMR
jgi:uncharacterized protein (TIGR02145 family)